MASSFKAMALRTLAQRIFALPALRHSLVTMYAPQTFGLRGVGASASARQKREFSPKVRAHHDRHDDHDDRRAADDGGLFGMSAATRTKLFDRIKSSALGYVSRKPYSRHDLSEKLTERFLPRSESKAAQNYQSRFLQRVFAQELRASDGSGGGDLGMEGGSSEHVVAREAQEEILASVIGDVLDRFEQVHLINDEEYAVIFARSKWRQSKWSPRKIETELRRRGVEAAVIGEALTAVFGEDGVVRVDGVLDSHDGDSEDDGMTAQGYELVEMARKQYESYRTASITEEAKKRRLIGYLQRRGFGWDVVGKVVERVMRG